MTEPLPPAERRHAALERSSSGPRRLREICSDLPETDAERKPGVGKLSVVEHVRHMLGMEQKVFAPRLAQVLQDTDPTLAPVQGDPYTEPNSSRPRGLSQLVEAFEDARSANLRLVEQASEDDWERPYTLSGHGRDDFAGLVERWSRHDDDHLRQIEIIVRNCEERNL